jgi:transposase
MAFREATMWEILKVLRRHHRGESQRLIRAATGKARKTIRRYVRAALALGWDPLKDAPDEALAQGVLKSVQPGPKKQVRGEGFQRLQAQKERIQTWIEEDGLQVTKVQDLLKKQGIEIPYRTLHRFVMETCEKYRQRKTTVRMDDQAVSPGEIAEIDFGRLGLVPSPDDPSKKCVVHALVVTLVHSRHQYVHITRTQKLPDLVNGLEDAWEFFGGVTKLVVVDNLKATVIKADLLILDAKASPSGKWSSQPLKKL